MKYVLFFGEISSEDVKDIGNKGASLALLFKKKFKVPPGFILSRKIYDLIAELAQNGSGIIIISDELPELIGLADRIMVIGKGRKAFEFDRGEVNQSQLLEAVVSHEKMRATQQ